MTIYQNVDFNPANYAGGAADVLAFAKKFWSICAGGGTVDDTVSAHLSNGTLAHPKFVNAGTDSHLLFSFAKTAQLVEVAGAYSTKALMDADAAPAPGVLVNCFDPDPALRGRYAKTGAAGVAGWGIQSADIKDKLWNDYNHPQRLLELIICSFIKSTAGIGVIPSYMGNQMGWQGPAVGNISDWRNIRLTLTLGCRNLWLGPYSKIGMHVQGNVAPIGAALTAAYGEGAKYFLPNYIQKRQLISDYLGFGRNSWGLPNDVNVVYASGKKVCVIDYTTDDDDWECFGDSGRTPVGRSINYGSAPIADLLADVQGNSYMLAHHPDPKDGDQWYAVGSASRIPDYDRLRGDIMLYGIKIESIGP